MKRALSYIPEIRVLDEKDFVPSSMRFATREEAEAYARDIASRWQAVRETRVVESEREANYALLGRAAAARA